MARDRSELSEVIVSTDRLFVSFLVGWPIAVATALASRAALINAALSATEYAGWAFLASAPFFTGVIIARGRSSQSIAQVLYDAEQAGGARRKTAVPVTRG
jgi:hypothetical protein